MIIYTSEQVRPYVYMGIHKITGEIYIGYREANKLPSHIDLGQYRTSSKIVNPTFIDYDWLIVAEFNEGSDAYDFEQQLIFENWDNPLLLNKNCHYGKRRFKAKRGIIFSESHRAAISKANKGKIRSVDTLQKLSISHRNQSKETRSKISESLKGRKPWNYGLKTGPQSEKQRLATSLSLKGKPSPRKGKILGPYGSQPTITCPHCGKTGGKSNMAKYHFDNCKKKSSI